MATPAQAPTSPPPAQPPAPIVYRGATVWSDITHYALIEDVNQLLETKFPTTADSLGRTVKQYYVETDNNGDHRVWAPQAIDEVDKQKLYNSATQRRTLNSPSSWRRYT